MAQEAISRINQMYSEAFNVISEAIIIVDSRGEIVFANQPAETLFYFENDLVGQALEVLIPKSYHYSHQKRFDNYTDAPKIRAMEGMQLQARKRDNTIFPVEISLSPVEIDEEFYTIAVIIDVTERTQMEEHLREAELIQIKLKQEQEMLEIKSRFVAMLSHEFRNPLAVIQSSSDLLDKYFDRLSSDKRKQHTQQIKSQIKKLLNLLDDVLKVSKSGSMEVVLNPTLTHLPSFCKDICQHLDLIDDEHFTFHIDEFEDRLLLDQNILTHILENLLTNARKYTPQGGEIRLDVTQEAQEIVFKVSDTGIGIPENDLEYLFTPFHRGSNVTNIAGTGLGLTIIDNYVKLHGGIIDVSSNINQGSIFNVRLPIRNSEL